jgi:archaemetzincin
VSLEQLCRGIELILPLNITLQELPLDIDFSLDPSRKQYHSTEILALLLETHAEGPGRLLGITPYDLFVPVLTFVFGQAQLNNRAAVFSTFRLHNEFYGLPNASDILDSRCLKEALHEIGHTYGLRHCIEQPCVMNSSTYVENIDLKPADFCLHCREHLGTIF